MLAAATHKIKKTSISAMTAIVEILEKAATMQATANSSQAKATLEPKYLTALVCHYESRMKAALKEAIVRTLATLSRFLATKSRAPLLPEDFDTDEGSHTNLGEGPIAPPFTLPPSVSLMEPAAAKDPSRLGPFSTGYLVLNIELASPKILQLPSQEEVLQAFGDIMDSMIKTCSVGSQLCGRAAESTLRRFGLGKAAGVRIKATAEAVSADKDRKADAGSAELSSTGPRLSTKPDAASPGSTTVLPAVQKKRNDGSEAEEQVSSSDDLQEAGLTQDAEVRRYAAEIEASLQHAAEVGAQKLTELDETTWKWEQTSSSRATNILKR